MSYMTKSKYVDYMECGNRAWLDKNRKSEKVEENLDENIYVQGGIEAGIVARGLFGPYTLIDDESNSNIDELIDLTNESLNNGTEVICEATFKYLNNICKVDILRKNYDDSYSIYEVKGTTNPYTTKGKNKLETKYVNDISYQYYVLMNCGINIRDIYIC